ncbi:MAG: hypothetical protein QXS90_01640 [Candidatus Diapherotrites archaeon]
MTKSILPTILTISLILIISGCPQKEIMVDVLVKYDNQEPVNNAQVIVYYDYGNLTQDQIVAYKTTNQNGIANFELLPGNYFFTAKKDDMNGSTKKTLITSFS